MDNTLGFSESAKNTSVTEWNFGALSDVSLDAESTARLSLQQNLHVLPTKEIKSKEPLITATLVEKLSYFSMYTCHVGKLEILCRQQNNVNRFFWLYISNVLCKSLPMTYVYLFLSVYAPDNHLYVSKMAPLCYGCNWIFAITGIFQLTVTMNATSLYFIYFILGVLDKVPWKRCASKVMIVHNLTYNCYNLADFRKKFEGANVTYTPRFYMSETENFSVAEMDYYDIVTQMNYLNWNIVNVIIVLLWFFAILCYRQLYCRERVWKVLFYTHMALCAFTFAILIHVVIEYEDRPINEIVSTETKTSDYLMNADFDILAESMTAPPIVHVINSKSTNKIKPSFGSGIISTTNAIMYIFKALTSYLLERHCERWVNATIIYWNFDNSSPFYIWPIYFATIYLGDLLILVFFAINAIVDYCVIILTFHCIVESIRSEWKWIKPWYIELVILAVVGFDRVGICPLIVESNFICWTSVSTLAETVAIFWIYPLSRLVDDINFHYGTPPTKLRVISFGIVPIFYFVKVYIMFSRLAFFQNYIGPVFYTVFNRPRTAFLIHFILIAVGIIFSIYNYVYKQKKGWSQLFKPLPEWGPKDYASRQLRKEFQSNEFIASQASRDLSRHLINKAELKSYKVDVHYDSYHGRSAWTKTDYEKIS